jgi:hypothetical protein
LFERSVGNIDFFTDLCDAYTQIEHKVVPDGESLLWSVLKQQIARQSSEVLIILDGLDKIEGGTKTALRVRARLHEIVTQRHNLRCIVLCRPIFDGYPPGCWSFPLGPGSMVKDIRHFLDQSIRRSTRLTYLRKQEMEWVIRRALERPVPSFLEANLYVAYIELHQTFEEITSALRSVPNSLPELIHQLIQHIDFKKPHNMTILSWLLVAERPMTFEELEIMMDTNFAAGGLGPDAAQFLRASCAGLVELRGATIQLLHPSLKDHLLNLGASSKLSFNPNTAHRHALLRCLEYIKHHLHEFNDAVLTYDESGRDINKKLLNRVQNDSLLEYCIRYYIIHYEKSNLDKDGKTSDFRMACVDSPALPQCERFYWQTQASSNELEQFHRRALQFRRVIFGRQSRSIVQNLITLAMLSVSSSAPVRALPPLCEAWSDARDLLGNRAAVCKKLAQKYCEIFSTQTKTDFEFEKGAEVEQLFE